MYIYIHIHNVRVWGSPIRFNVVVSEPSKKRIMSDDRSQGLRLVAEALPESSDISALASVARIDAPHRVRGRSIPSPIADPVQNAAYGLTKAPLKLSVQCAKPEPSLLSIPKVTTVAECGISLQSNQLADANKRNQA